MHFNGIQKHSYPKPIHKRLGPKLLYWQTFNE